jgi:hypothetical protein
MELIQEFSKEELVKGLPYLEYKKEVIYDVSQYKKQVKSSFKIRNQVSTNRSL